MRNAYPLNDLDMPAAMLERERVVSIDTPLGGVDAVRRALGRELPLDALSSILLLPIAT